MKGKFTDDGKCLACEVTKRGVDPSKLIHKVKHVCMETEVIGTLTADDILKHLHEMIDRIFKRTDRSKKIDPVLLKHKLTLWVISGEYLEYEPQLIIYLLKELLRRGSIESSIGYAYPFDAYFIPKSEL